MSDTSATPEERLEALGIVLPVPPEPVALYVPAVRSGPFLWVSGQIPVESGALRYAGKVGASLTPDQGSEAARLCVLNGIAHARKALGSLDKVRRVVQLVVYVNSAPGFSGQPGVANGASECLVQVFGEAGKHGRVAVGVNELPLDAAVELSLVLEVAESASADPRSS